MESEEVFNQNVCSVDQCQFRGGMTVREDVIYTPFQREFGNDYPSGPEPFPKESYTRYDLFCLETKLTPHLRDLSSKYYMRYGFMEFHGAMRTVIDICLADEIVHLNNDEMVKMQKLVDKLVTYKPKHCLLFDSSYQIKHYPKEWVRNILPFLDFPSGYTPIYEEGKIYIDLSNLDKYKDRWERLYFIVRDKLTEMYNKGAIVLYKQDRFVLDWDLTFIGNINEDFGLFVPNWRDNRFAKDRVKFLSEKLTGDRFIKIKINGNFATRHAVSVALEQFELDTKFTGKYCIIDAKNIIDAKYYTNLIETVNVPENVATISLNKVSDFALLKDKILSKYPKTQITAYFTDEYPLRTLSWTIPREIDVWKAVTTL